jgi:UDP-sugar transporter A1/2/3
MLQLSVPSLLYTVQNNLLFVGTSHLTACTFQVTYQLKIFTTGGASMILLGTYVAREKWFAMALLSVGVAIVNMSEQKSLTADSGVTTSRDVAYSATLVGFFAVALACCTSALASVYLELLMKRADTSIWLRNIQLALVGIPFALVVSFVCDRSQIAQNGFLQGYTPLTWGVIACQAIGGIIVSMVLVYADNILKCFSTAISIVVTFILSWLLLGEISPDKTTLFGILMVLFATLLYNGILTTSKPVGEKAPLIEPKGAAAC